MANSKAESGIKSNRKIKNVPVWFHLLFLNFIDLLYWYDMQHILLNFTDDKSTKYGETKVWTPSDSVHLN